MATVASTATTSAAEEKVAGQCVPIDQCSYIPIPPEVLQQKLGHQVAQASWGEQRAPRQDEGTDVRMPVDAVLAADPQANTARGCPQETGWDSFCEQLRMMVQEELSEVRECLNGSYQPFDPARRRWVGTSPLPDKEAKFAREFVRAATLAGFTPVSHIDLERTRELKADLLSLPVTILWDRLDSRWIEALFTPNKHSDPEEQQKFDPQFNDFGGYAFVLKRGVSVERREGRLLMQKLDSFQSQWLIKTGRLLNAILCRVLTLAAMAWTDFLSPAAKGTASAVGELLPAVQRRWRESGPARAAGRAWRTLGALTRQLSRRFAAASQRTAVRAWPSVREWVRGARMRLAGTQVLRRLLPGRYQYTYWLFGNVLENRWSEDRAALIDRLTKAWEREAELRGRPPRGTLPEDVAARERRDALAKGDYIERVAIEHVPLSFASILEPAVLQEPQFQEILVAYRLQEPASDGHHLLQGLRRSPPPVKPAPQRPIFVRRFVEVPMKDIKLVFPPEAWRVRGRPLDMIKLDLITLAGCLGVVSRIIGASSGYLVLTPLLLLLIRTILGHNRMRVYCKSVTSSLLFDRCLDKDAALMRQLPDAADAQVFAECALAFWALLDLGCQRGARDTPMAVEEDEVAEHATAMVRSMLSEAELPKAGFRANLQKAISRLEKWRLVTVEGEAEAHVGQGEGHGGQPLGHGPRRLRVARLEDAPGLLRALRAEWLRKQCDI